MIRKNKLAVLFIFVFASCVYSLANAATLKIQDETFQSGAVFNGTITFTNSAYTKAIAVNGTLVGGGYGTQNISWVWLNGFNFASGDYYGTYLMNGTNPTDYSKWNAFAFNRLTLEFADFVVPGNSISVFGSTSAPDIRTGGSISIIDNLTIVETPIPAAIWLFGSAFMGLFGISRKTQVNLTSGL